MALINPLSLHIVNLMALPIKTPLNEITTVFLHIQNSPQILV